LENTYGAGGTGNVNYYDWFSGIQYSYLQDADKVMEVFFTSCWHAGPQRCAFYQAGPTADGVRERFLTLLETLRKSPVVVPAYAPGTDLEMPLLVTYERVAAMLRRCLYRPLYTFPPLARALAALERRDGVPFYRLARGKDDAGPNVPTPADPPATRPKTNASVFSGAHYPTNRAFAGRAAVMGRDEDTPPTVPLPAPQNNDEAFPAVMCADGEPIADGEQLPDALAAYADALRRLSRYTGASSVPARLTCVGRRIRPRWRYTFGPGFDMPPGVGSGGEGDDGGDVEVPVPPLPPARKLPWHDADPDAGADGEQQRVMAAAEDGSSKFPHRTTIKTAFPILFIGNTADNATPLQATLANSRVFPGSAVLVQDSYGHGSLAAPSSCTARVVRAYFRDGVLPDPGTVCEQDVALFGDLPPPVTLLEKGEEDEIAVAIRELSRRTRLNPVW
jgi:hypothetical protein